MPDTDADTGPLRRPHTGRRRNDATREAILEAAVRELSDGSVLTVDGIARAAGVGKQTIYRWWPSKGAVLLEALKDRAAVQVSDPDTGDLHADLSAFLMTTFAAAQDPQTARLLRAVVTEAATDPQVAEVLRDFIAARRSAFHALLVRGSIRGDLRGDADLDLIIDQAYGLFWYRLLSAHAPLTAETADRLAASLLLRSF
jgi:AcrR family transcriptional regulator